MPSGTRNGTQKALRELLDQLFSLSELERFLLDGSHLQPDEVDWRGEARAVTTRVAQALSRRGLTDQLWDRLLAERPAQDQLIVAVRSLAEAELGPPRLSLEADVSLPTTGRGEVFISYAAEDYSLIEPLTRALHGRKVSYRMEKHATQHGLSDDDLRAVIGESRCCVVVLSARALENPRCLVETAAFWGAGKPILAWQVGTDSPLTRLPTHLRRASTSPDPVRVARRAEEHLALAKTAPDWGLVAGVWSLHDSEGRGISVVEIAVAAGQLTWQLHSEDGIATGTSERLIVEPLGRPGEYRYVNFYTFDNRRGVAVGRMLALSEPGSQTQPRVPNHYDGFYFDLSQASPRGVREQANRIDRDTLGRATRVAQESGLRWPQALLGMLKRGVR